MTFLQFISYLAIAAFALVIIRAFWVELAIIIVALYVTGQLLLVSLASAILWAVFITGSAAGWGWTFLFFFLTYIMIGVVYYMIVYDILHMIGDALISFFRKLR